MRYLKTLLVAVLASVGMVSYAQTWTAEEIGEGTYFLYNVGKGMYFAKGNNWGSQASMAPVETNRMPVEAKLVGGAYFLRTGLNGTNNGLEWLDSYTMFVDQSRGKQSTWTFTKVGDDNGPVYNIVSAANHGGGSGAYLTASADNTVLGGGTDGSSDYAKWKVISVNSLKSLTEEAMQNALASESVDATALILNSNFSWALSELSGWDMQSNNKNLSGGCDWNEYVNPVAESWLQTFTLTQNLQVPNGVYQLKAQAACHEWGGNNDGKDWPVVYANDATSEFNVTEEADRYTSMGQMSGQFTAGKYEVKPIKFVVSDGSLTIGARSNRTNLWQVWDNFRLEYQGMAPLLKNSIDKANELVPTLDEQNAAGLQAAIDEAQAVLDNEQSTNAEIQEALEALEEAYKTFNAVNEAKQLAYDVLNQVPAALYPEDFDWKAERNYKYYKNNEGKYQLASREVVAILIELLDMVENPSDKNELSGDEAATMLNAYARLVVETHSVGAALDEQGDIGYADHMDVAGIYESFHQYYGKYGVPGFDPNYTGHIENPDLEDGTDGWTNDGFRTLSDQPLTDAISTYFGEEAEYTYFDQWSKDGFKAEAYQEIDLPAGRYMLTVAGRGGANKAFTEIGAQDPDNYFQVFATNVTNGVTTMQSIEQIGDKDGVFGNGWNDASVFFTMPSIGKVKIGIRAASSGEGWVSATRFRLTRLGDNSIYLNENESYGDELNFDALTWAYGLAPVDMLLHKKMEAGKWYSIALPGDISWDQIVSTFGEGTLLAQPIGVEDLKDGSGKKLLKFLEWDPYYYYGLGYDKMFENRVDGMIANVPYLIKPAQVKESNRYLFKEVCATEKKSVENSEWSWGAISISSDPDLWGYFWASDDADIKFYPNYDFKPNFADGYTIEFNDTVKAFTGIFETEGAEIAGVVLMDRTEEGLAYGSDKLDIFLQQLDEAEALGKQKAEWYPGIPAAMTKAMTTMGRIRDEVDATYALEAIKSAIAEAQKAYEPSKEFNALMDKAEELLNSDHNELVEGADAAFKSKIEDLQKRFDALIVAAPIADLIDELKAAIAEYKDQIFVAGTIEAGNYYIKNVATGKFLNGGNSWGTRASLSDNLDYFTIAKLENGAYTLESRYTNGGEQYYLGPNYYVDNGTPMEFTITPVAEGVYTIACTGDSGFGYFGWDGSESTEVKILTNAKDPNVQWTLISDADMLAALADASLEEPVKATFLIKDPNFCRNHRDVSAWDFQYVGNPSGSNCRLGANSDNAGNYNCCAEAWRASFTLTQELELPNGVYMLTAQGAVTDYDQTGADFPVFFAGEETSVFAEMDEVDRGTSMYQLTQRFDKGDYTCDPMIVEVDDGTLSIGARCVRDNIWTIWDNFQLTYFGNADIDAVRAAYPKNTGATTGINEVNTGVNTGAIYNLNGVRVNNMTKKGVYIVNGKKVVVK